jgi:hypothetical protein
LEKGADVSFMKPFLRRDPINLLVGFTIASHDDGPLAQSFRRAFSLYDDGAEWSVAAAIMGVKLPSVLADLEDIATVAVVAASDGDDSFTAAAAAAADAGRLPGPPGEGPAPTAPPRQTGPPPTEPPPPPSDKPDPPEECQNVVECAGEDITDPLDPTPSPSPGPTDDPDDPDDGKDGPLNILGGGGGKSATDAVGVDL